MRGGFDKRWLLPPGILAISAVVAVGIILEWSQASNKAVTDCSGPLATDYACYQQRYQNLVRGSGVEAAFAELKDESAKNEFVRSKCHQMTHVIGRTSTEIYDNIATAFGRGEHFCGVGYYHGVMEATLAGVGPDEMLDEADTYCAELREDQERSDYHYGCAHGLGHGFMGVLENELFDALEVCDALQDGWERERCYGGVFMQNKITEDDPSHPSKYLKADQPLYPCTDVDDRYKDRCYRNQVPYALETQGGDLAKVFELCAANVEKDHRPECYQSLGQVASDRSEKKHDTDVAQNGSIRELCALGEDPEAGFYCIVGAARSLVYHRKQDEQAGALCESLDAADHRAACLRKVEARQESARQDGASNELGEDERL